MLSKKDLNKIQQMIVDTLTVKMKIQKVRDDKTGQPLAVEETIEEDVFIPSMFIQLLSFYEGASRGLQEQVCKQSGKLDEATERLELMGKILLQSEESMKTLVAFTQQLKQLGFDDKKQIDYVDGEIDES